MTRGGYERVALAMTVACLCSIGPGATPARAETASAAAPSGRREAPIDFDIPAQPVASALNSWAVQSNAQVFVDPGPVARLMAPAVKGTMTPRQALSRLLGRSNLQVTQGANGVFVIKPRLTVVATPEPAPPPADTSAGAPAAPAAPPGALTARAGEGAWTLGLAALYSEDRGAASGGASVAVSGEYFISDQLAAGVLIAAPRTHSFDVSGTAGTSQVRASARLQASILSLRYYLAPERHLRPYLGAGMEIASFTAAQGAGGVDRVSVGPALEAGLDLSLSPHWLLNAAVGWAQVRPGVTGSFGDIHLDPVNFGLGFVYRFGGKAQP